MIQISNSQINSQYFPRIQKNNQDTSPYIFSDFLGGMKLKFLGKISGFWMLSNRWYFQADMGK